MSRNSRDPAFGSAPASDDQLVRVGLISGPFGTGGEARIISYCERPEAIAEYSPLVSAEGRRAFHLEITRKSGKALIARLDGVDTREQAAALAGTGLFARRESFPAPEEDQFYHADLIGLEVRDGGGKQVGSVVDVLNHGAGDLIEVTTVGGDSLLVPFTRQAVPEVRIGDGLVIIDRKRC